jgi:TatD DNase family protein
MNFVDSHAHLYMEEFREDRAEVMQRADAAGVEKIFLPNIDSSTTAAMLDMETEFPGRVFPMMGLHPCSVKEDAETELSAVREWFSRRRFAAVGETGLDFYWDLTFREQQIAAFSAQADLALQYDVPLVIHSRNSTRECIDIVREKQKGALKGVFHCFSGTTDEAREIIDLGFFLGIGGVLTFKKSALPELLRDVPLEHLLLETDAPYLAPVPFRGKRNESSYVPLVAEKLAAVLEIPLAVVAEVTTRNASTLFGL